MEPAQADPTATRSGGGVHLRLFASLDVPAGVARRLAGVAEAVASRTPGATPVPEPDLHVTFAFLGSVAEEYVPAVAVALEDAARSIPGPVACTVTGTAPFGGGRVLAATVDVDLLAVLASVRERFVDAVAPYVSSRDQRAWHPHVSIVRAPRGTSLAMPDAHDLHRIIGTTWVAGGVSLHASLPSPAGSLYRQLHDVPFGEAALHS